MQFSTIIRNVHLPLTETNRLYDIAVFGEQIANIAPAGEAPFASSAHTEFDAEATPYLASTMSMRTRYGSAKPS